MTIDRWFRRRRPEPTNQSEMRLLVEGVLAIGWPGAFGRYWNDQSLQTPAPAPGQRAVTVGATAASVSEVAESGDMEDIRRTGEVVMYEFHDRVHSLELSPFRGSTLTLVLETAEPVEGRYVFRFVDATVLDLAPTVHEGWEPEGAEEIWDFCWDGGKHFLLVFITCMVIIRAERLELERLPPRRREVIPDEPHTVRAG